MLTKTKANAIMDVVCEVGAKSPNGVSSLTTETDITAVTLSYRSSFQKLFTSRRNFPLGNTH